jgi:hypothetical protein
MQQAIDIRRASDGRRFDVYQNETIEVNMGGISLLNLADRTVSYTNSFKLPRTANNEQIFEFASQPTRNNLASIDVVITKGLFQKTAILKVKEFDGDYKCEVCYDVDSVISTLSELNFYTLPVNNQYTTIQEEQFPEPTTDQILLAVSSYTNNGALFSPFGYKSEVGNAAISVLSFFNRISALTGITFSGAMLTNADLLKTVIFNKYITFLYESGSSAFGFYRFKQLYNYGAVDMLSCKDVLKALSQILSFDIVIKNKNIELKPLSSLLLSTPINIENLDGKKTIEPVLSNINNILYKTDKRQPIKLGADSIISNGAGEKDIITIKSFIPVSYANTQESPFIRGGFDIKDSEATKEVIIMSTQNISASNDFRMTWGDLTSSSDFESIESIPLDLNGAYSSILNPIFSNPVILNTDGYIDILTADNIMNDRVILSVKLGGRYWVDDMKYNLTTGKAVLKLIKL